MNNLLFSIIIPTRQRHDTLKFAIQSVLNQTYDNFEIIVVDNFSTSETAEVAKSFQDDRIKYHRAPHSLSMADNWELGLSKTTGNYIFVLGDDDALMPDAIQIATELIERSGYKIISWLRYFYAWDSSIVPWLRNHLGVNLQQSAEIRNSYQLLQKFYRYQIEYEQLPMIYNSFVHRDIINRVRSINGRYFDTHCPDAFSGIANAYFSSCYLYSYRALSITGTSGHSNGAAHLFPTLSHVDTKDKVLLQDKIITNGYHQDICPLSLVEIPVTPETAVADIQLKAKEIFFPKDSYLSLDINNYLSLLVMNINRDPSVYNVLRNYIELLAAKYNIVVPHLPEKILDQNNKSFQGIITDINGKANHLRINCAQAGIFNVADAAKLALALLPHHSQLQIYDNPGEKLDNSIIQPQIAIDGVFFQLYNTGIARVWRSLLEEWAKTEYGDFVVVLDRVGTAPKIEGIRYYQIPAYDYNNTDADRQMLQNVCHELGVELFISSYYTTPLETPSIFMAYDMIPEVLGADFNIPMWREKRRAIEHATSYLAISHNTKKDLAEIYTIEPDNITVAHCGVSSVFKPASVSESAQFRYKYDIKNPYFIIGSTSGYKNIGLFVKAFALLPVKTGVDIVCTGGNRLDAELTSLLLNTKVHYLSLDDRELSIAYSQALALVYPSKYEGFGMPLLEAMASGCPVITCRNSSLTEVCWLAALYISDSDDVTEMVAALCDILNPSMRDLLIGRGIKQSQKFSWKTMADVVEAEMIKVSLDYFQLSDTNLIIFPDWSKDETAIAQEFMGIAIRLVDSFTGTLLVDIGSNPDNYEFVLDFIFNVIMSVSFDTDIDLEEYFKIIPFGELAPVQCNYLKSRLMGRIDCEMEDSQRVSKIGYSALNTYVLPQR